MLDFLKAIVDALSNIAPRAIAARHNKKLTNIAVRLWRLYVDLNEVLFHGEQIIEAVSHPQGIHPMIKPRQLRQVMLAQKAALEAVENELRQLAYELSIIDGRVYRDVRLTVLAKHSSIELMAASLEFMDCFPLTFGGSMVNRLEIMQRRLDSLGDTTPWDVDVDVDIELDMSLGVNVADIRRNIPGDERDGIASIVWGDLFITVSRDEAYWSQRNNETAIRFMNSENPRVHIDNLANALESLRAGLLANFTLADVIPRVSRFPQSKTE